MTSSTGTSPMLRPSRSSAGTTWKASCCSDAPPNCGRPYEFTCEYTTDSFAGVRLANDEPLGSSCAARRGSSRSCLSGPTSPDRSSTRGSASPSTCSFSRRRDAQPPGDFRQRPAVPELLLDRHAVPLGELPVLASRHSLHLPSPECRWNDGIRWDSGGKPLLSETNMHRTRISDKN